MDLIASQEAVSAWLQHIDFRRLGTMNALQLDFLMLIFAGWVNRGQQDVIEYLQEENRVLREQLGTPYCCCRSSPRIQELASFA